MPNYWGYGLSAIPAAETSAPASTLPREVWVTVAANFVIALGFGLVAPALPTFAHSFDVSVTLASLVITVFAFARLVFAPLSGWSVSVIGERRVYIIGVLIVAVSTGACAFAGAYWHLLVLRAVAGIGSTMFTVSGVGLLFRLTPPTLRGRASGLWATSFLLGTVTGPLVGGGLIAISLRTPFLVYAAALIVAVLIVWLALRRSTLIAPTTEQTPTKSLDAALRISAFRAALVSNFAHGWAVFGVRIALIPLFVTEALNHDAAFAGMAMSLFGAGNVAMLLVSGRLSDRLGRKPPVIGGLLMAGLATAWIGMSDSTPEFLAATVVAGLGTGFYSPPQQAAVADILGGARGGQVLTAYQMLADVGAILGPLVAGVLADQLSFGAAFAVTGVLLMVSALTWLPAGETLPRDHSAPAKDHPEKPHQPSK